MGLGQDRRPFLAALLRAVSLRDTCPEGTHGPGSGRFRIRLREPLGASLVTGSAPAAPTHLSSKACRFAQVTSGYLSGTSHV